MISKTGGKIRILVADDQPIFMEGVCRLLQDQDDMEVIGKSKGGQEIANLARELAPDVAIIDMAILNLDGIEATKQLKAICPQTAVVILSAFPYESYLMGLLQAGVAGYMSKDIPVDKLIAAVRRVHAGEAVFDLKDINKTLQRLTDANSIGGRELDVLKLAAKGVSNKDIAEKLSISIRTVQTHMVNIFRKLKVSSRTEAVLQALREGWLTIDDIPLRKDQLTEREPEESLLQPEKIFHRLLIDLPVGAYVVQHRKFRLFNPQFQRFLGYSREELLAMDCLKPAPLEDRETIREDIRKRLKSRSLVPYEHRFVDKDGKIGWVMETVIPWQYQGKRAVLGYFVEITERKQLQQALLESKETLNYICASVVEGILATDLNGTIIEANRRAVEMHGFISGEQMAGKSIFDLIASPDREDVKEALRQIEGKGPLAVKCHLLRSDRSAFTAEISARMSKDASGYSTGFIVITRDISLQSDTEHRTP